MGSRYCDGKLIKNLCIPRGTLVRLRELQSAGILPNEDWAAIRKCIDIVYQLWIKGAIRKRYQPEVESFE